MINQAKQICPNSFRISTFGDKTSIWNNRDSWFMMIKIFIGGKTTIPSSPTNEKGKPFLKKHCRKHSEERKSAFSRFQILKNPCIWFSCHYQRNKDQHLLKSNTTGLNMLSSKNTCQCQDTIYIAKPKSRMISCILLP